MGQVELFRHRTIDQVLFLAHLINTTRVTHLAPLKLQGEGVSVGLIAQRAWETCLAAAVTIIALQCVSKVIMTLSIQIRVVSFFTRMLECFPWIMLETVSFKDSLAMWRVVW